MLRNKYGGNLFLQLIRWAIYTSLLRDEKSATRYLVKICLFTTGFNVSQCYNKLVACHYALVFKIQETLLPTNWLPTCHKTKTSLLNRAGIFVWYNTNVKSVLLTKGKIYGYEYYNGRYWSASCKCLLYRGVCPVWSTATVNIFLLFSWKTQITRPFRLIRTHKP